MSQLDPQLGKSTSTQLHRRRKRDGDVEPRGIAQRPTLPWWMLGAQTTYLDGNEQPLWRGWIHAMGAVMMWAVLLAWQLQTSAPCSALMLCLAFKSVVYAASAAFHLVCWQSPAAERAALIVDVSLVPVAVLGSVMPFSDAGALGVTSDLALGAAILAVNIVLVAIQFRRGHRHPPGDSTPRSLVCVSYYMYNEIICGRAIGFDTLGWMMTPVLYGTAFACAAGVDKFRESCKEPMLLPHHRKGRWSLHEDFHFMLALADAFSFWLGYKHSIVAT